ncbi:gluconate 2-dehydrogenase subunit 3 family protein [Luteimonas aquatica]|uniref:gluconate 2-dehydrogenase subunit 3 family protein n=1 Tax=Luteimonas aquatica TaxID=450364 RepID=UPI001F5ADA7B|nr:gluconate 2-dehydrogenase subunit 3 family protein [Luteimonas aquatica]
MPSDASNFRSSPDSIPSPGRREALRRVGALLGGAALIGGSGLLQALERMPADALAAGEIGDFAAADIAFLDEIAETILPETGTPGAKAAKTGAFMALMVTDCYSPAERRAFREGMRTLDAACMAANGTSFMDASAAQRLALLTGLDREQKLATDASEAAARKRVGDGDQAASAAAQEEPPAHYFYMMKQLALLGYFTSEIGYTQAMRYIEVPGRYDPCAPYAPGEPSWGAHA